jgi:hypothetical protein
MLTTVSPNAVVAVRDEHVAFTYNLWYTPSKKARRYSHEEEFSLFTTAQAKMTLRPSASMPTASKSVSLNLPYRKVPFTATILRKY